LTDGFNHNRALWDHHAATDPLWAVLSFPDKSANRWAIRDFMLTGEREIALLYHRFSELGLAAPTNGQALDFGCGVGRLTQALARRQPRALGVDISPVMIDLAQRLNRYPDRARYQCTADTGLDPLPSAAFQLIYSNIVLQHVPSRDAVAYLHDFFRLLDRDGLLVFQLPSHLEPPGGGEITPMPDAAYSGAIELTAAAPGSVAVSQTIPITVQVRNTSNHTWRQPDVGPLALGNHWFDGEGRLMVVQDDGRSPLLQVVTPGLEWPVLLTMTAPGEPGTYVCEIDFVHEGVTWFAGKGSRPLRFPVTVTRDARAAGVAPASMLREYPIPDYPEDVLPRPRRAATDPLPQASFPMDGVRRGEVLDIIHGHGARLVYLEEDRRAGPQWASYRYFVAGRG
jgi:SAM-dependent methyltransferase